MDGVLAKPINMHDLGEMLGGWLKTGPAADAPVERSGLRPAVAPHVDTQRIAMLLEQIGPLLKQHKFDAVGHCQQLENAVAGTEAEDGIAHVCRLVRECRFDLARQHLRVVAKTYGWKGDVA